MKQNGSHEHKHPPNNQLLTDVVIGMSDGLTIPFVLAAGLSGAGSRTSIFFITCITAIVAGSVAMGIGAYQSGRSEFDDHPGPGGEEKDIPELEKKLSDLGLSDDMRQKAIEEMAREKEEWVNFLTKYELGPRKAELKRSTRPAFNIALSYASGGIVPLAPYFFITEPLDALKISAGITLLSLFILGYLRSRLSGQSPWIGAIRSTIYGALAGAAAFGVARLFHFS